MDSRPQFRRPILLAATLALFAAVPRIAGPRRPLRRYRQAAGQPDRRPQGQLQGRQHASICRIRRRRSCRSAAAASKYSIELYAKGDRKPKPEFFELVAAAAAIIFTVPKDDTQTGTSRCIKRMGIFRGDKVTMRFRRLNMECTRTKTEASIAVTRGKDE